MLITWNNGFQIGFKRILGSKDNSLKYMQAMHCKDTWTGLTYINPHTHTANKFQGAQKIAEWFHNSAGDACVTNSGAEKFSLFGSHIFIKKNSSFSLFHSFLYLFN